MVKRTLPEGTLIRSFAHFAHSCPPFLHTTAPAKPLTPWQSLGERKVLEGLGERRVISNAKPCSAPGSRREATGE